jgi:hypothetical protein
MDTAITEASNKTSRRALLAGAAGAAAAVALETIGRVSQARAATGDNALLGVPNVEETPTSIQNTTLGGVALVGVGNGVPGLDGSPFIITGPLGNPANTGVRGVGSDKGVLGESRLADASLAAGIGVQGASGSGPGVRGDSSSGPGVRGNSASGDGVEGVSAASGVGVTGSSVSGPGVHGNSQTGDGVVGIRTSTNGGGAGVQGFSGVSESPSTFRVGVRGVGLVSGVLGEAGVEGVNGVQGRSTGGPGVLGQSFSGNGFAAGDGVYGVSGEGTGVHGLTNTGTGILGEATNPGAKAIVASHSDPAEIALAVTGKAVFSRSGIATIPMGTSSATVSGVPLTVSSIVLATVQTNNGVYVTAAVPNVPGSSFTLYINRKAPSSTPVGWFVAN